MDIKWPK